MRRPLRVLIIEDSELDAQLLLRHLRHGGCDPEWRRVETAAELMAALAATDWEVILSDYRLPNFAGLDALKLVQSCGRDLPFILVSGAIGEEETAAVVQAGASDFLLKDRLARLAPAVFHELAAAAVRRQRTVAESALGESETRYRAWFETVERQNLELEERVAERTASAHAGGRPNPIDAALPKSVQQRHQVPPAPSGPPHSCLCHQRKGRLAVERARQRHRY